MGSKKFFQHNSMPVNRKKLRSQSFKRKQIFRGEKKFPVMCNVISFIRIARWICDTFLTS